MLGKVNPAEKLVYRVAAVVGSVIVLAMVVLAVFAWLGQRAAEKQSEGLRADLVTTNVAWGECKSDLATAKGEVQWQTDQVRVWKEEADRRQKSADERVAKARQEAEQYRKRAARLAQAQPQTADRCEAAAALYVQVISEDVK